MKRSNIVGTGIASAALLATLGLGSPVWAQTGPTSTPTPLTSPSAQTNNGDTGSAIFKPQGPGRGGPPGPVAPNTQDGAARELNHAYSKLADYQKNVTGSVPQVAGQLFDKGKALYQAAIADYQAGRYSQASERARAAGSAASAALHLVKGEQTSTSTVAGLTPPPTSSGESESDKAARELSHAYSAIGNAQGVSSQAGSDAAFYLTTASNAYRQALSDYNAKRYTQANERAHAAKDAAEVVQHLAKAAGASSSPSTVPGLTPPPSVPTTP